MNLIEFVVQEQKGQKADVADEARLLVDIVLCCVDIAASHRLSRYFIEWWSAVAPGYFLWSKIKIT